MFGVKVREGKKGGGGGFVQQEKKLFGEVRCCDSIIADKRKEKFACGWNKARTNKESGIMNPRLNRRINCRSWNATSYLIH